jgi:hypothetical protein
MGDDAFFGLRGPEHVRFYQDPFTLEFQREEIKDTVYGLTDVLISSGMN